MQKVNRFLKDFENALNNLKIGVQTAADDLSIDGAIKRFELCYELSWKLIKSFLEDRGIICRNPKACFKEAYLNGLIDDEQIWLQMIDDRNYLVHTYTFEKSREIFERIKVYYLDCFIYLYNKVREE